MEVLEGRKEYPMPEPPWNNLFIQNPLRFGLSSDFHLFVVFFFFFPFWKLLLLILIHHWVEQEEMGP